MVAALADPGRRAVYAGLVLGTDDGIPGKQRAKALASLQSAGLIAADGTVNADAFKNLLALEPAVTRTGIDRFIKDGRIETYPARPTDRAEILEWAAAQVLRPGETISEKEISERLESIVKDFVSLRRYLVDAGLVTRDADGTAYTLNPKG